DKDSYTRRTLLHVGASAYRIEDGGFKKSFEVVNSDEGRNNAVGKYCRPGGRSDETRLWPYYPFASGCNCRAYTVCTNSRVRRNRGNGIGRWCPWQWDLRLWSNYLLSQHRRVDG